MKKIFFMLALILTACMPDYEKAPVLVDYSRIPLMELPVSRVSVISEVNTMEQLPHVEKQMPMSPVRSLNSWSITRLRPNYQTTNKAEFIIREASMLQDEAPEANIFTYDNYKYTLKYAVTLAIKDENGKLLRSTDVEGFFSRKLPQRASVDQRNNMFTHMLRDLDNQLDKQMPEQIRQNLLDQ